MMRIVARNHSYSYKLHLSRIYIHSFCEVISESDWESDCQCTSCNGPGFYPSIRRHSGTWGAADESVLNTVEKKNPPKNYFKKIMSCPLQEQ